MGGALVIGYGNALRGDDGIGPAVAAALATLGETGRAGAPLVLDPVQLTPELAVDVAAATLVVFVDARADAEAGAVARASIRAGTATPGAFTHAATPAGLLALARDLYGAEPPAWVVSVGAASFEPGAGLSPAVWASVPAALAQVRELVALGAIARAGPADAARPADGRR
jgi:hydrogenase maturation protease